MPDTANDLIPTPSRRSVLKRGAVASAVVWAAPMIISSPAAGAVTGSVLEPDPCVTTGVGTGLRTSGSPISLANLTLGSSSGPETCVLSAPVGLQLSAVCGAYDDGTDTASARVESLTIPGLASNLTLATTSRAGCDCGKTGGTTIVSGTVLGVDLPTVAVPANTTVVLPPPGLGAPVVTVVVNEQACSGTTFIVRGVHITVTTILGTQEIVIAESAASASDCSCSP